MSEIEVIVKALRSDLAAVGDEIAMLVGGLDAIARTQSEAFELSRENIRAQMAATVLAGMFSEYKEPSLVMDRLVRTAVQATDQLLDELDKPRQKS